MHVRNRSLDLLDVFESMKDEFFDCEDASFDVRKEFFDDKNVFFDVRNEFQRVRNSFMRVRNRSNERQSQLEGAEDGVKRATNPAEAVEGAFLSAGIGPVEQNHGCFDTRNGFTEIPDSSKGVTTRRIAARSALVVAISRSILRA
jgi:hypothetical protein